MRKYRLSTKYRGPKSDLVDYISMSPIIHYKKDNHDNNISLNQNLKKIYIRNFYEYHHRKRPSEGKTAKQEYDKELKKENKKKRLKEIESQISFDRVSSSSLDSTKSDKQLGKQVKENTNEKVSDNVNKIELLQNDHMGNDSFGKMTNDFESKRKSAKKFDRKKISQCGIDFFDTLLLNKKFNYENEYKKCVKICKKLSLAKQIQVYQLENFTDNYNTLEDCYDELNQKFKFINRECKLIEKDIERFKSDYCRLVKKDLIEKNNIIKENNCIPIYDKISLIDLDVLGDLKNYERAYDKYNFYVDYEEYIRLNKLDNNLFLNNISTTCDSIKFNDHHLVDENNNKINIEFGTQKKNSHNENKSDDEKKITKQHVDDILYLIIKKADYNFFCNKIKQLVQDNLWCKAKIKRLKFDILNEEQKNKLYQNSDYRNDIVKFEFSDNLEKQKPLNRKTRHTINVNNSLNSKKLQFNPSNFLLNSLNSLNRNQFINKFSSQICGLNVFEITPKKVEIYQMKLKMQLKELEPQITQLKKLKETIEDKLKQQEKSLKDSQMNKEIYEEEQRQLLEKLKHLKIKERQLLKENEKFIMKVHQLTK